MNMTGTRQTGVKAQEETQIVSNNGDSHYCHKPLNNSNYPLLAPRNKGYFLILLKEKSVPN